MKVSLEICDFFEDEMTNEKVAELEKLIKSVKPIYLD